MDISIPWFLYRERDSELAVSSSSHVYRRFGKVEEKDLGGKERKLMIGIKGGGSSEAGRVGGCGL